MTASTARDVDATFAGIVRAERRRAVAFGVGRALAYALMGAAGVALVVCLGSAAVFLLRLAAGL